MKVSYDFHQYSDKRNKPFLKSFLIKLPRMKVEALFMEVLAETGTDRMKRLV